MTAIDDWITEISGFRRSASAQPIVGQVAKCVAAWQQVLSGSGGTVTSVGLALPTNELSVAGSPVTTAGTITATWKNQVTASFFAGPASGPVATPNFRPMVLADLPGGLPSVYLALAGGTMAGAIGLANGTAAAPELAFNTNYGFFYDTTNSGIGFTMAGVQGGYWNAMQLQNFTAPGAGLSANIINTGEGPNNSVNTLGYATSANPSLIKIRRARGTQLVPAAVLQNDLTGSVNYEGWGGTGWQTSAQLRNVIIEPTPSDSAMGGSWRALVATLGTVTLTEVLRAEVATGLSMFGANPVIDANRLLRGRVFTVGTLPTAVEGARANISDATLTMITGLGLAPTGAGTNHVPVAADNVGWKIV